MRVLTFILCLAFLTLPALAKAQENPLQSFAQLPIQHEGRIKPIGSFARAMAKNFSGSGEGALPWLMETLFNPAAAENIKIFKIIHPELIKLLDLPADQDKLYSYRQVTEALAQNQQSVISALQMPEENWTQAQKNLIALQSKAVQMGDLLASLTLYLPLSATLEGDLPKALQPYQNKPLTYGEISTFYESLQEALQSIQQQKGEKLALYTKAEIGIVKLAFTFDSLQQAGQKSALFKVIPKAAQAQWLSPWEASLGQGDPSTAKHQEAWQALSRAYITQDKAAWSKAIQKITALNTKSPELRPHALTLESLYNAAQPFTISAWLYGLCLLLLIAARYSKKLPISKAVYPLMIMALTLQIAALAIRIYILQRPPVSTLYESIQFVSAATALYSLISYRVTRSKIWLPLGAGGALALILIAFTHNQDGDDMMMLTAVLNTNFWLATHVICITLGYAVCLIVSALAHYSLLKPNAELEKQMRRAALWALLLTAIGTVLGGIWADQSWGRFWGWDPKENGAMLIVLWLIWVIHGRISGQLNALWHKAGLAALSMIVALSWFGVNLLSVGLHAYGFTDSAALSLASFIAAETAIIGWLIYKGRSHA